MYRKDKIFLQRLLLYNPVYRIMKIINEEMFIFFIKMINLSCRIIQQKKINAEGQTSNVIIAIFQSLIHK